MSPEEQRRDWLERYYACIMQQFNAFQQFSNLDELFVFISLQMATMNGLMMELLVSEGSKYSNRPLHYRTNRAPIDTRLKGFSDQELKAVLRMSCASFMKLQDEIHEHPVFETIGPSRKQELPGGQLAVALDRLGHNGNGVESTRLGCFWDRSGGACSDYLERVVKAILSLESNYLAWPSPEDRDRHSARMAKLGFPGCVGFVDGTTIPLSQRPEHQGDFYYDRHGRYSLNLQVVCDMDRRILYLFAGYTGMATDNSMLPSSSTLKLTRSFPSTIGRSHDYKVFCSSRIWK